MEDTPRVIIKKQHASECWAVRAVQQMDWYSPWYLPNEPTFYGDRIGGRRGNTTNWVTFRCNSTNCDAWGLIRQMFLEDTIHDEVKKL